MTLMHVWAWFLVCLAPLKEPTPEELGKFLDELYRAKSSHARVSMTVTTPTYTRTLSLESHTLGNDFSLIRIQEPRKEKGISTLKRNMEMWNWLPKIQKMVRVPPSMMMGSWMGSDFTNDDLMRASSWTEDYTAEREPDEGSAVVIVFRPKPNAPVTWQKVVSRFDRASWLPIGQDFYDEKGRKVRSMTFDDVRELGGKTIPCRITLIPLLKEGHRTEIRYLEMTFNLPLDPSFFSQNTLKQGT